MGMATGNKHGERNESVSKKEPFDINSFLLEMDDLPTEDQARMIRRKRDEIMAESDEIKAQMDLQKADAFKHGKYADPHWWQMATIALRVKSRQIQRLQEESGQLRREESRQRGIAGKAENISFGRSFMWAARKILTGSQYSEIESLAKRRHAEHQEEVVGEIEPES